MLEEEEGERERVPENEPRKILLLAPTEKQSFIEKKDLFLLLKHNFLFLEKREEFQLSSLLRVPRIKGPFFLYTTLIAD